jgi:microcin C transport system substrate-binding protein
LIDVTRRRVLVLGGSAVAASWVSRAFAQADAGAESHGMSAFGDLNYPADFKNFNYVNVSAPKGGTFSTVPSGRIYNQSFTTFNSLNSFILKGDGAAGMEQTFASLMVRAGDEPDAMYGLVARAVKISPDKLTYRFTLRPEARFHDGSKLTAHDAAFSINVLKEKGHPIIRQQLRDMTGTTAEDDATLVVTFAPKRGRDVPLYTAGQIGRAHV